MYLERVGACLRAAEAAERKTHHTLSASSDDVSRLKRAVTQPSPRLTRRTFLSLAKPHQFIATIILALHC